MKYSDETLMAYADGELDAGTRASIEAAAATDPELARAIARHRAIRDALRGAYDDVLDEPVPDRLLGAIHQASPSRAADVRPMPSRPGPSARARRWSWPEWGAMAATLVVGALIGSALRTPDAPLFEAHAEGLAAAGRLSSALSTQLTRDTPRDGEIRTGLSFRGHSGVYCRTFSVGSTAGLACRDADRWRVEVLARTPATEAPGDAYRMAGPELPRIVLEAVDARIEGEPLDAEGEAAARERGWRD